MEFCVYLPRAYAPANRTPEPGEQLSTCTVYADTPEEAANIAWKKYGSNWLRLIDISKRRYIKHISLYVKPVDVCSSNKDIPSEPVLVWSREPNSKRI